jgi:hypothetical protein
MPGMALGQQNPQTSHQLTFLYGDFLQKQSIAITQEAWSTLNTTVNRLLLPMTNMLFKELQGGLWKGRMPVFKMLEDIFSTCCNSTFQTVDHMVHYIIGIFKNIKVKINGL